MPADRRNKFYINGRSEYVKVEGTSCLGSRSVKLYISGSFEYV